MNDLKLELNVNELGEIIAKYFNLKSVYIDGVDVANISKQHKPKHLDVGLGGVLTVYASGRMNDRKPQENTWTTKDGRKIPIKKLGDDHLVNILSFLERAKQRQDDRAESFVDFMMGDAACDCAERTARHMLEQSVEERFPIYSVLKEEAERRRLRDDQNSEVPF